MKIVLKILSLVMCVILFLTLNLYLITYNVSKIVTKDNAMELVKDIDVVKTLEEQENDSLNALYQYADNNNLDRSIITDVIGSDEVKEIAIDYFMNLVDTILYGKESIPFDSNKIVVMFSTKFDEATKEYAGIVDLSKPKQMFMNEVQKVITSMEEAFPSYETIIETNVEGLTSNNITSIQTLLKSSTRTTLMVATIVIVIIIGLLNWSIYRFAIWTGITMIVSSIPYLLFGMMFKNLSSIIRETDLSINIIKLIETNVGDIIFTSGVVTLVIGIVQIVYYKIVKRTQM